MIWRLALYIMVSLIAILVAFTTYIWFVTPDPPTGPPPWYQPNERGRSMGG